MRPLLTVPEVAKTLRCGEESVRVMARRGDIESIRVGGGKRAAYRFTEEAVDAYLSEKTKPVRSQAG